MHCTAWFSLPAHDEHQGYGWIIHPSSVPPSFPSFFPLPSSSHLLKQLAVNTSDKSSRGTFLGDSMDFDPVNINRSMYRCIHQGLRMHVCLGCREAGRVEHRWPTESPPHSYGSPGSTSVRSCTACHWSDLHAPELRQCAATLKCSPLHFAPLGSVLSLNPLITAIAQLRCQGCSAYGVG